MKDISEGNLQKRNKNSKRCVCRNKGRSDILYDVLFSSSMWIKEEWKREFSLEKQSIKKGAEEALKEMKVNA